MDHPVRTLDEMRAWSVSRSLPHDQEKVWEALADREAMRRWSSVDLVGPRSMGAHITLAVEAEAPENGVILAFERPRLYSYSSAGETFVWEVIAREPRGSRLTLSVTLDGEAAAPVDEAAWQARQRELESHLDALDADLAAQLAGSLRE
ncbi:MAG: SRPBCC family protein [Gemmatimonadaceae bacterium]